MIDFMNSLKTHKIIGTANGRFIYEFKCIDRVVYYSLNKNFGISAYLILKDNIFEYWISEKGKSLLADLIFFLCYKLKLTIKTDKSVKQHVTKLIKEQKFVGSYEHSECFSFYPLSVNNNSVILGRGYRILPEYDLIGIDTGYD